MKKSKKIVIITIIAVIISIFLAVYLFGINTTEISWSLNVKRYVSVGIIVFIMVM